MTRTMKQLSDQLAQHTTELEELKKQIKILDKRPLARCYTVNPRTKVTHRVLTSFEDAGIQAKTFCKWPYIQAGGSLTAEAPTTRSTTCDTCLPQLKASLP